MGPYSAAPGHRREEEAPAGVPSTASAGTATAAEHVR